MVWKVQYNRLMSCKGYQNSVGVEILWCEMILKQYNRSDDIKIMM